MVHTSAPAGTIRIIERPESETPVPAGSELIRARCERQYPISGGIPCFGTPDAFYDEYASHHCPFAASPAGWKRAVLRFLPFWSHREWKFWRRVIPPCESLLEFGCGRGREIFLERARKTTGFDGSLTFLRDCARRYSSVALGQLPELPFRSGSFDVVASSHTIGHVAYEDKNRLISEIARVLKVGGITAYIIETDSDHPSVVAAKKRTGAYRRQFIEQHGHIGLEHAGDVIRRFLDHGFRLQTQMLVDAAVPSAMNYRLFFNVPELAELPEARLSRRLHLLSTSNSVLNPAYEVGFGAFHRTVEQWFGKPEFAQVIMVSFVKERD